MTSRTLSALLMLALCSVGAAVAWAQDQGPASPHITLDIHDHASNGSDGYTNTTASNGGTYSYKYSGGENGGGDVIFRTRGRVTINVSLANSSGYSMEDVTFRDDTHDQLSWLNSQGGPTTAVIQDVNDTEQTARYKITVKHGTSIRIPCDPIIDNRS